MALFPIRRTGARTVVSGGEEKRASWMSSNPATARSSGTSRPASRSPLRAPYAERSLAANTAVGRGSSARTASAAASPASMVKSPGSSSAGSAPMPCSRRAAR